MTVIFNTICATAIQNMLFFVLFFICLSFYIRVIWKKRHMLMKSWNFPGPFNFPVIGAAYIFFGRQKYAMDKLISFQQKYPKGAKLWLGYKLIYSLQQPDHIKRILGDAKFVDKDLVYNELRSCIGEGLLTAPLHKWKKDRRTIARSFNQNVLNSYVNTFAEKSELFNKILDENCQKELDIHKLFMTRCIIDITLESLFGVQLDVQKTNTRYADTMDRMNSIILKKFLARLMFWKIFDNKEYKSCMNDVNDIVDEHWIVLDFKTPGKVNIIIIKSSGAHSVNRKIVLHRNGEDLRVFDKLMSCRPHLCAVKIIQQKLESSNKEKSPELSTEVGSKRLGLLDHIMETGKFDALEVKEQVITFLGAGADTVNSAINSIFVVLGMFPQIQLKVYEEIISILGNDRLPEHDDLQQMIYMERVIKETLRLFSPVPNFLRFISEDIDIGEFIVPKGANVNFGVFCIHRNSKYWPNPLKFDPDRFLPDEVAKRHPCTYIPFAYGPRNCIGLKYAMMNIKVILSTVIRKFKIHCKYKRIEDIHFKADFVLRFRDGTKVSMTPRK